MNVQLLVQRPIAGCCLVGRRQARRVSVGCMQRSQEFPVTGVAKGMARTGYSAAVKQAHRSHDEGGKR